MCLFSVDSQPTCLNQPLVYFLKKSEFAVSNNLSRKVKFSIRHFCSSSSSYFKNLLEIHKMRSAVSSAGRHLRREIVPNCFCFGRFFIPKINIPNDHCFDGHYSKGHIRKIDIPKGRFFERSCFNIPNFEIMTYRNNDFLNKKLWNIIITFWTKTVRHIELP